MKEETVSNEFVRKKREVQSYRRRERRRKIEKCEMRNRKRVKEREK